MTIYEIAFVVIVCACVSSLVKSCGYKKTKPQFPMDEFGVRWHGITIYDFILLPLEEQANKVDEIVAINIHNTGWIMNQLNQPNISDEEIKQHYNISSIANLAFISINGDTPEIKKLAKQKL